MQLNPEQQRAVEHIEGPLLVLAGAGSGKTRVLTYRLAYFIAKGFVDPENACLLTFTNKAATEMKERMQLLLSSKQTSMPTIATFHALCAKILRIDGKYIGLSSNFVIYDSQDQIEAIKMAMNDLGISAKEWKPTITTL